MKTKVWAHRGASAYAPENTLEAFLLAAEQEQTVGAGCTADEKMARWLLSTMKKSTGSVTEADLSKDYTLAELKNLNFNKTHLEYQNVKIPTLREVYEALKPTEMTINVELKTGIFWYKDLEKRYSS